MKHVFILHDHHASFATDITKITDHLSTLQPQQYKLYGIFNNVAHNVLKKRDQTGRQQAAFAKIHELEKHTFENIRSIIDAVIAEQKMQTNSESVDIAIVTGAEASVVVCGQLNKHYGLSQDNYDRFNDKVVMKDILSKTDVRLPKYMSFDKTAYHANPNIYLGSVQQNIPFPMFVKPINQNGSLGTEKIENEAALAIWAQSISNADNHFEYEVDEYIDGTLYHIDSFIQNRRLVYVQASEDIYPCYEFMKGKPEGSIILAEDDEIHRALRVFNANALQKLGMPQNGITHMEVFRKANGEIVFLEVAYRPGGAVIPAMYETYLGRDIRIDHVLLQLDPNYKINIQYGDYAAWVSFPLQKGVVIECNEFELHSPKRETWKVEQGYIVAADLHTISDEACNVFFWNRDSAALRKDFEALRHFKPCNMQVLQQQSSGPRRASMFSTGGSPVFVAGSNVHFIEGGSPEVVVSSSTVTAANSSNTSPRNSLRLDSSK